MTIENALEALDSVELIVASQELPLHQSNQRVVLCMEGTRFQAGIAGVVLRRLNECWPAERSGSQQQAQS